MQKNTKIIIAIVALLCMGLAVAVINNSLRINVNKIVQQKGYTITNQTSKSIEVTIDKKKLPLNMDFARGISFAKDDVVLYQTDTSTMYLKSIQYANSDAEYLSLIFYFDYVLPEEAKIIIPYDVKIEDHNMSYSFGVTLYSKQVKDTSQVFDNAISLHGAGPSEQFCLYLKTDVFIEAKNEISFTIDGLNELSYIKE